MESALRSKEVRDQQAKAEPEDAAEEMFWWPAEAGGAAAGPLADKRFIL